MKDLCGARAIGFGGMQPLSVAGFAPFPGRCGEAGFCCVRECRVVAAKSGGCPPFGMVWVETTRGMGSTFKA